MSEYRFTVGGDFSELLRAFDRLDQRAQQSGQAIGRGLGEGMNESSLRSIAALEARLERLRAQQVRLSIDSSGFQTVAAEIRQVEGLLTAINRQRVTLGADPGSIVALRAQLDALNAQLGRVAIGSGQFRDLQREIKGVERDLRRAGDAGGIAAKGIGAVRGAVGLLGGLSIGAAVTGFFRESIQQAIQLETATRRLTNTLGPQGAGAALGFVRGISDQLGLSFRDLVGSYGRFTAAATAANVPLQQQRDLFTAVSRAGQSLGLSTDEVNGAFLALQQIASKGTVSMEELRQQLGERLPIALAATAKGMGVSTQALIKMVETGQLSANKFFPAFTKGLNELTKGSQGMPTAAQNLQRFTNEWETLQVAFGESLLPEIVAQVKALTAALKNLKVGNIARDLGFGQTGFGGLSEGAQTMVSDAEKVQQKYNLTSKELSNVASEARKLAGVTRTPLFGTVSDDSDTVKRYGAALEERAKAFRAGKKDGVAELKAEEAALAGVQTKLSENIKAQQESNALAGQRAGVDALEAEAKLIGQVAAGRMTQADADKAMAGDRKKALEEEIRGQDALIAKLQEAKAKGAEGGNDKAILTAQTARSQKVLELAKLEADASRVEVQRRQEILQLAQSRLEITKQQIGLEDQAGQVALARLRSQQQVAEALMGLAQAQEGLTQSQFGLDSARQGYALRTAEEELANLRNRGAGVDAIRQQEDRIASLKQGAQNLEFRTMEASIVAAQQRFDLERRVLELKQAQQLLEAQSAQGAAQQNTLQQQQKLLDIKKELADPSINSSQRQVLQEQLTIQEKSIGYSRQQETVSANHIQNLGIILGLEKQTLNAQQQTAARGLAAQAAAKGWEMALAGPLQKLDGAAGATTEVAGQLQNMSAGFISAGGQTVQIKANLADAAGATGAAADAANALANGYASANANAEALLGTLQRISSVPQARYAGGPVDPTTAYKINELGQESLLSPGGRLSLIHAPANSMWRPPTRGTVLPAGLTSRLKDAGAFSRTVAPAAGGARFGNLEREIAELKVEVRAWRQKDWNVQVRTPSAAGILRSIGGR